MWNPRILRRVGNQLHHPHRCADPQGSVGRAYPQVEIQIAPLNGEAQIGESGSKAPICSRATPWARAAETALAGRVPDGRELGWLDPQGYLYLAGRKRRMVLIADQNTFPEEIENFLLAQAGVAHCAVIARPIPRGIIWSP